MQFNVYVGKFENYNDCVSVQKELNSKNIYAKIMVVEKDTYSLKVYTTTMYQDAYMKCDKLKKLGYDARISNT